MKRFVLPSAPTPSSAPVATPLALLIGLAFAGSAALAQDAPAGAAPAPEAGKLQTVTVTAERVTEDIKTVPISVSTLNGEALDVINSAGEDIRALAGRVPSLNIESSFGRAFPRFYIRGYGNTDFHLNASQPVSLVYDDVVQENPILKGFPVFDVDAVEVLAGPQGTLFGRNTPAGVVKIDSVAPSRTANGYANLTYGSFGTANVEAAVGVPLGPDWAARVSVLDQHRDNWVTNTAPNARSPYLEGYNDGAVRVQFLYKPSSDFSALFNLHGRSLDGTARLFRGNLIQPGTNSTVPGFDVYQADFDGLNKQTLDSEGANARLRWKFGDWTLHSITGYEHVRAFSRGDVDGGTLGPSNPTPFPDETSDALTGHEQFTQEFRLEHSEGALAWQAGVYFFHEKYGISSLSYATPTDTVQTNDLSTQTNNAWAAFASATYDLAKDWKLRGGLRYTADEKNLDTDPILDPHIDNTRGLTAHTSDSRVTWDLSATYTVTPDVDAYARVATGFRGSSIFPAADFNPVSSARPETITSYEAGLKGDLFDKRARFSADVFYYDVHNQQLSAVGGAGNTTLLLSAHKTIGQGVEASLDAYLTPNLLVTASGSYNYTKIHDKDIRVATCGSACSAHDEGTTSIDGNPLPQAPRYVANVTARYGIPTRAGNEWYVYTDWSYRSRVNFFLYESTEFTGKSLTQGGVRAGYIWDNGKYELAAFGRNITNQVRVTGAIDFDNLTGFVNDPRTWGAQFKAQF